LNVRAPRKGESIDLLLEDIDDKGRAFGQFEGRTVRTRGGVPGSHVRVRVHRRRRSEIEAAIEEVLRPGENSVDARCRHFGSCGGCSFQNVLYTTQLAGLERSLERLLEPITALRPGLEMAPTLGCSEPWHYRNKMDFTFGNRRWIETSEPEGVASDFALGLHVPGRYDKVLDVQSCDIAFKEATPILNTARELALEAGLSGWDVHAHDGLLRHLLLRRSFASGEILAALFTTEEERSVVDPYLSKLLDTHPEITSCVQRIKPGSAMVASGGEERLLKGEGFITEKLGGLDYRISTDTFFQTNSLQAELLCKQVVAAAGVEEDEVVYDLCCGCGPWALSVAAMRRAASSPVYGFELVESAVEDARENARNNGIDNAVFIAGDIAEVVTPQSLNERKLPAPSLCIVDPPRAGLSPKVVRALTELRPRRIVYVSCNPRSAVRDLTLLGEGAYYVASIQPIDLFPHTPHLECVFTVELDAGGF
jgi:23S rRNA (uracil1939-C5)-methyltransferase